MGYSKSFSEKEIYMMIMAANNELRQGLNIINSIIKQKRNAKIS